MTDALQRVIAGLEAEQLLAPEVFRRVKFAAGERFIAQGEPDTTVYLITAGSVRVTRHSDGHTEELASLDAPTIVGELAAFSQGRTADVTAQAPVEALALDAVTVRDLCQKDREFARHFNELVWHRAPPATLDSNLQAVAWTAPEEQERLVTAIRELARQRPELFEEVSVTPDPFEPFIREGREMDRVYLILAGEANVSLPDGRVITVGPGSPLGEIAALSPRGLATATVRFTRQSDLLSLSRDGFRELRKDANALVAERLNQSFTRALPQPVKETLRSVRDQNTEALILRASLDIVHGAAGIYKDLNPATTAASPNAEWGTIRQKSSLIQAVASLLRAARTRADIAAIVTAIREDGLEGMPALKMFKGEAALTREDWLERADAIYKRYLPEALSRDEFDTVRRRFELLKWLNDVLVADGALDASRLPGATAAFVRACFTAGILELSRDVIFNGTAGGFLAHVKPGESLLCPSGKIAGYEGEGRFSEFPVTTRIRGPLADRLRDRVTVTSTHVSVGAPGEATYDLIRDFVARGFESIDVESAAIAEAVAEVNGRLTPIYTCSDNPLHSEHDRFDSLAVMGPFFEGSRFNAALWDVLSDVLADCR